MKIMRINLMFSIICKEKEKQLLYIMLACNTSYPCIFVAVDKILWQSFLFLNLPLLSLFSWFVVFFILHLLHA